MSHCSSGSRTQSSSSLALFDQPVRGRDLAIVFRTVIGFIVALTGVQTICAQTCSTMSLQGAPPVGTFSTTLNVSCTGAGTIDWDDGSTFAGPLGAAVESHSFGNSGPWYISVSDFPAGAEQFLSFPNSAVPAGVFSGKTIPFNAIIAAASWNSNTGDQISPITVSCGNVVGPDGSAVTGLNISCSSDATYVTATTECTMNNGAQNPNNLCSPEVGRGDTRPGGALPRRVAANQVNSSEMFTVNVTTSGLAGTAPFASRNRETERPWLLPSIACALLIYPFAFPRSRTRKLMLSLIAILGLSLISCGGGFVPPPGATAQTAPGTYLVTVQISSTAPGFVQISLIVPLTVLPTQ
jgi:hypothetical protein